MPGPSVLLLPPLGLRRFFLAPRDSDPLFAPWPPPAPTGLAGNGPGLQARRGAQGPGPLSERLLMLLDMSTLHHRLLGILGTDGGPRIWTHRSDGQRVRAHLSQFHSTRRVTPKDTRHPSPHLHQPLLPKPNWESPILLLHRSIPVLYFWSQSSLNTNEARITHLCCLHSRHFNKI